MSEIRKFHVRVIGKKKKHLKKLLNVLTGEDNFITSVKRYSDYDFERLGVVDNIVSNHKFEKKYIDFLYDCASSNYCFDFLDYGLSECKDKVEAVKLAYKLFQNEEGENVYERVLNRESERKNRYVDFGYGYRRDISLSKIFYAPNSINVYRRGLDVDKHEVKMDSICELKDWEYDKFGATNIISDTNFHGISISKDFYKNYFKEKQSSFNFNIQCEEGDCLEFIMFVSRFFDKLIFEVAIEKESRRNFKNTNNNNCREFIFKDAIIKDGKMEIRKKEFNGNNQFSAHFIDTGNKKEPIKMNPNARCNQKAQPFSFEE